MSDKDPFSQDYIFWDAAKISPVVAIGVEKSAEVYLVFNNEEDGQKHAEEAAKAFNIANVETTTGKYTVEQGRHTGEYVALKIIGKDNLEAVASLMEEYDLMRHDFAAKAVKWWKEEVLAREHTFRAILERGVQVPVEEAYQVKGDMHPIGYANPLGEKAAVSAVFSMRSVDIFNMPLTQLNITVESGKLPEIQERLAKAGIIQYGTQGGFDMFTGVQKLSLHIPRGASEVVDVLTVNPDEPWKKRYDLIPRSMAEEIWDAEAALDAKILSDMADTIMQKTHGTSELKENPTRRVEGESRDFPKAERVSWLERIMNPPQDDTPEKGRG